MLKDERLFLQALKAAVTNEKVQWKSELSQQEWMELFRMADVHHILPLIYEAVYACLAARNMDMEFWTVIKKRTIQMVLLQTLKTNEFAELYRYLKDNGVTPLVVKGIVCRDLYPQPDYRISGDEDLLILPEQFEQCHQAMLNYGMKCVGPEQDLEQTYEIPYGKPGRPIYIELHKSLFPPNSEAYGELNSYFAGIYERAIEVEIEGNIYLTMGYTDHLFYLICHAFKHFLHSGFGIRQVCDIVLMANAHGKEIDWEQILSGCKEIHADLFAAALFRIGRKYLSFDPDTACLPEEWRKSGVDERPLLEDMLSGGVYGAADRGRLHSSTITLGAIIAGKKGRKLSLRILRSLFPGAAELRGRYPYLQTKPWLLPAAWIERLWKYRKALRAGNEEAAGEIIKIGEERVELMKKYRIIER